MKKIIITLTCFSAIVLCCNTVTAQSAKTNEPAIDTKGAEALKKEQTDKTNTPDSKRTVETKMKEETLSPQENKTVNEEPTKGVKVEARPGPVAKEYPKISTIDPGKQPPPRTPVQPMVSAGSQKVNN